MNAEPAADFLRRVVRWVAIVCLAWGLVSVFSFAVSMIHYPGYFYRYGGLGGRVSYGMNVVHVLVPLTAVVGGWALLYWKPWARRVLIGWAVAHPLLSLTSYIMWFIDYANAMARQSATSRTVFGPSVASQVLTGLFTWFGYTTFPMLVLAILMQPEVRDLWANIARGAFEVLPIARPADLGSPSPGNVADATLPPR